MPTPVQQRFAQVFEEFGLRTAVVNGRIVFVGTHRQAETENDRIARLIHDKKVSAQKRSLLIRASGCCEYRMAVGA